MASPMLQSPADWLHGTLEPRKDGLLIEQVHSGGTPATSIDEYWDGDIPWLTPRDISGKSDELFVATTERNLSKEGLAHSSARLMPPESVLLSKRAPVGLVAINAVPMATNQGFLNFRCGSALRPVFFALWLRANLDYLHRVANGSTYPELYYGDLFEFEIAVPSLAVQDKIINISSALQFVAQNITAWGQAERSIHSVQRASEQAERIRQVQSHMLPLLLSGIIDATKVETSFLKGAA